MPADHNRVQARPAGNARVRAGGQRHNYAFAGQDPEVQDQVYFRSDGTDLWQDLRLAGPSAEPARGSALSALIGQDQGVRAAGRDVNCIGR